MDKKSNICVIGAGGVGGILIDLLASNGYKNVKIVDNDTVEVRNLKRQNFNPADVGQSKAKIMGERYGFEAENRYFTEADKEPGILISCVDNNESRIAIRNQPNQVKIFCANENKDAEAYIGCKETYEKNKDAFDPNVMPEETHCDDEDADPQTRTANTTAAIMAMQLIESFNMDLWIKREDIVPVMVRNCGPMFETKRLGELKNESS